MGNKLRDVFSAGTPDEFLAFIQKAHADGLERRKEIRLVEAYTKDGVPTLYRAEPFCRFVGDCEYCEMFVPLPGFVEGGRCGRHYLIGCGWGFTCKYNLSEENKGWDEFERICKEG